MDLIVRAPSLGEGVEELSIGRLIARVGEMVAQNAPLLELESDKVVTEFSCPVSGVLRAYSVAEGDIVRVGDPLAVLEAAAEPGAVATEPRAPSRAASGAETVTSASAATGAETVAAAREPANVAASAATGAETVASAREPANVAAGAATGAETVASASGARAKRFLSPLAKKLAALHRVDPAEIRGTGLGGRVMKQDILDHVAARGGGASGAPTVAAAPLKSSSRAKIAERMVESLRVSAQVLTVMEADMSAVIAHRAAHRAAFAQEGARLTLTAYFIAAAAAALRAYPAANASWVEGALVLHPNIDVGLAVSLGEEGLLAPVIRGAADLSLAETARAVEDLAVRSRSRALRPDEVRGGTFTVTNHGTGGSLFATPIIVQPQVGILGVGAVKKRAVVVEGPHGDAIAIRPMVYLSFVFDHRAMDGEGADRFLSAVVANLEGWGSDDQAFRKN